MRNVSSRAPVLVLLGLAVGACSGEAPTSSTSSASSRLATSTPRASEVGASIPVRPEALTPDTYWSYLVGTWSDPGFSGYIKFSLLVDANGAATGLVWHPNTFKYHAEHLTTLPEFAGLAPADIDRIALRTEGRRVLLGTLLVPKDAEGSPPNTWVVQLMSQDPLAAATVAQTFAAVSTALPSGQDALRYYPVTEQAAYVREHGAEFEAAGIRFAQPKTSDRICYASGWGVGRVRIVHRDAIDAEIRAGRIGASDILVLDEVPRELPAVAGIVVAATSSPSSHPALLANMLGIPFFYEKDASTSERWRALAAQDAPIFLQATGSEDGRCEVLIRDDGALDAHAAAQLAELKKPLPVNVPMYDEVTEIALDLDVLGMGDASKVGAKAANVAELRRLIPNNSVERGLGLPITAFARFLAESTTASGAPLRPAYDALLQKLLVPGISFAETADRLDELRVLLEKATLSPALEKALLDAVGAKFAVGTRVKFRSSSNVEDKPEFNGAGLYESKGACVGDDALPKGAATGNCGGKRDPILGAIKKVWASLYTYKAWAVRRTFGVDESHTGMGILVQPSFIGELANGVIVSSIPKWSFVPGKPTENLLVTVNGFPGEDDEVTNPPAGKIPETMNVTANGTELAVASTELPRGRTLLQDSEYAKLFELVKTIHAHYVAALKPADVAAFKLDLEWKLEMKDGQRRVVIKQVRQVPTANLSTQGLGRGTFVIGEQHAKLCPATQEFADPLTKLRFSFPIDLRVALHEIAGDDKSLASPIASLRALGQDATIGANARVAFTPWKKVWASANTSRTYTVNAPFTLGGRALSLQWTGPQTRSPAQPKGLLDGVQTFWSKDIVLSAGKETEQRYSVVVGDHACEQDAYQNLQPGSFLGSSDYARERTAPLPTKDVFEPADSSGIKVRFEERTSFQGFDKTRFMQIDKTTIEGILARPIEITEAFKAVYAPGHHNFSWGYAIDVFADATLTAAEKADLTKRGIRYLVLETPRTEIEIGPLALSNDSENAPTAIVFGVDEAGKKTRLGSVNEVR